MILFEYLECNKYIQIAFTIKLWSKISYEQFVYKYKMTHLSKTTIRTTTLTINATIKPQKCLQNFNCL